MRDHRKSKHREKNETRKEMKTFSCFNFSFLFYFTSIVSCSLMPDMYMRNVIKESIFKQLNVTSISQCLFQCRDLFPKCIAAGFISSELKNSKRTFATCHLIKDEPSDGEMIMLEVFVSFLC